jgi:hypothetical protein
MNGGNNPRRAIRARKSGSIQYVGVRTKAARFEEGVTAVRRRVRDERRKFAPGQRRPECRSKSSLERAARRCYRRSTKGCAPGSRTSSNSSLRFAWRRDARNRNVRRRVRRLAAWEWRDGRGRATGTCHRYNRTYCEFAKRRPREETRGEGRRAGTHTLAVLFPERWGAGANIALAEPFDANTERRGEM